MKEAKFSNRFEANMNLPFKFSPRFVKQSDMEQLPIELTSRIIHTFSEGDPIPLSLTSYLPWATRYEHVGHSMVLRSDGSGVDIVSSNAQKAHGHRAINWSSPFGFHHHLCENYQKVISFAQVQLRMASILSNPLSKSLAKLVKQETLSSEWAKLIHGSEVKASASHSKVGREERDFFRTVLDQNDQFPVLNHAYS